MISKSAAPDAAAAFDGLVADFFSVWFRFHPDVACEAGVGGYSQLLPAQSDDELSALAGWLESLVVALEEVDFPALDAERRIDLELMFAAARVEHRELHLRDWRSRDPLRFLPVGEIYRLTLAPPGDLREALVHLLGGLPGHLTLAQSRLCQAGASVAPELAQAAIAEAENGRCYVRELARSTWLRRNCRGWNEIDFLADEACAALVGFADVLRHEIAPRAAGALGCGTEHLRFLLRHRHFMDFDPMDLGKMLDLALEETEDRLGALCKDLGIDPEEAPQRLDAVAVDGRTRMESYHTECERLHRALERGGLVTLPLVALHISERPDCPRPNRFGADYVPGWDDESSGTLFLGSADGGHDVPPDALARVRGRCLSRTWGGAHLIAFAGGTAARSMPRRVAHGSSLVLGWDLYLRERLASGAGFGASVEERLHGLLYRRLLILGAQLDLGLHTGQLSGGEVCRRLTACGQDRARLIRMARAPGDAIAGVVGWRMITGARRLMEQWQGSGFNERAFHDRLVGHGPIPLPLVLRHELGADVLDEVTASLVS